MPWICELSLLTLGGIERWCTLSGALKLRPSSLVLSSHAINLELALRDAKRCSEVANNPNIWSLILSTRDDKDSERVTLLCVDDDKCWLQYEKIFLETFGYAVVTASSGREALELAQFRWFDVAIVDYCMPEMNGKEFAVAMRRRWPRTPIVMLSGMLDVPDEVFEVVDAFVGKEGFENGLLSALTFLKEEHSVTSSIQDSGS